MTNITSFVIGATVGYVAAIIVAVVVLRVIWEKLTEEIE